MLGGGLLVVEEGIFGLFELEMMKTEEKWLKKKEVGLAEREILIGEVTGDEVGVIIDVNR